MNKPTEASQYQHFNPKEHAYLVAYFARWNARPDGGMSSNDGVWWGFNDYEAAVEAARKVSLKTWMPMVGVWRDIPKSHDYGLLAAVHEGLIFEPRKGQGEIWA